MANVEKLKSFLETTSYETKRCSCLGQEKGMNPFVTISREAGAGGHSIAEAILSELDKRTGPLFQGWHVIDHEICELLSREPGLQVSYHKLITHEYHSQIQDMLDQLVVGDSPQDKVVKKIFMVFRSLASAGKVILVGRGGCALTRNLPLGVHLRLVAPLDDRIRATMTSLGSNEKKTRELIQEQDKGRKVLFRNFFNCDVSDPLLYDEVWNTSKVPAEVIARSVVDLIEARKCHCPGAISPLLAVKV